MEPGVGDDVMALERYRAYLLVLARVHCGHAPGGRLEPSDAVQATLLEAHLKRDQFRGQTEAEMAGWLRRMLAFNLVDAARAAGRAKRDSARECSLELDASSARLGALLAAGQSTPSEAAVRHEDAIRLAGVLERLPQDQRRALVLRHCEGLGIEEISRHMGRTPAAVAGLLKRGLKQLRVLLQDRE